MKERKNFLISMTVSYLCLPAASCKNFYGNLLAKMRGMQMFQSIRQTQ
jgi:hypothetical protein